MYIFMARLLKFLEVKLLAKVTELINSQNWYSNLSSITKLTFFSIIPDYHLESKHLSQT